MVELPFVSRRICLIISLFIVMFCTGCGSNGLVPVSGKVMNGDQPLKAPLGLITFHPDKDKGNTGTINPRAELGPEGTYELFTDGQKGAPAGWYKVVVVASEADVGEAEDGSALVPQYYVQDAYMSVETTPLSIEVKEGGDFTLKLDPMEPPKKQRQS